MIDGLQTKETVLENLTSSFLQVVDSEYEFPTLVKISRVAFGSQFLWFGSVSTLFWSEVNFQLDQ